MTNYIDKWERSNTTQGKELDKNKTVTANSHLVVSFNLIPLLRSLILCPFISMKLDLIL